MKRKNTLNLLVWTLAVAVIFYGVYVYYKKNLSASEQQKLEEIVNSVSKNDEKNDDANSGSIADSDNNKDSNDSNLANVEPKQDAETEAKTNVKGETRVQPKQEVVEEKKAEVNQDVRQAIETETKQEKAEEPTAKTENRDIDEEKIMAPDFTVKTLEGKEVSLSDYRGKLVFLNFWAVWCPYCVREMPDLNSANDEFAKAGGRAIVLALDVQEDYDTVKRYVDKNKLTLPILMDETGSVAQMYRVQGIPVTYVINPDGSLADRISGATTKGNILKIAERLLK